MKKRIMSFALVLCLLVSLLPTVAMASGSVTISATDNEVQVGDVFDVSLIIPSVTDLKAYSASFNYSFDNSVFEVVSFTAPSIGGTNATGSNSGAGFISCTYDGTQGQNTLDFGSGLTVTATFKVKEDAGVGSYDFTVDTDNTFALNVADDGYTETALFTVPNGLKTSVTVSEDIPTDPYTANISTTDTEFTVNDPVVVTVNVGGTVGSFASSEIELTYNTSYLQLQGAEDTYATTHTLNGAGIVVDNGTIKLVDHGETNVYPDAYVLNFTATNATTGAAELVTLTDAKFSTAENAIGSDLIEATGENALSLTIKNADLLVTLPESGVVTGNGSVPYGNDYTFSAKNNTTYMYYDYEVIATMGGQPVDNVKDNGNGTWTIENVTGDLVISVTETAKQYAVTWDGNSKDEVTEVAGINNEQKATYGTNITFKVPADKPAADSTDDSWTYTVSAVMTGTDDTVPVIKNGIDVTIAGAEIKGAITITVTKNTVTATDTTITIDDDDVKATVEDVEVTNGLVEKGKDVVLDLTREPGYTYKVEVNGEDKTAEFDGDNSYTISNVQSPVTVVVTKTFDLSSANVQKYLTLNETNMWLVTINGNGDTEISGKTYSYDGQNMYWSSKYQAYCYLVVATELSVDDAKAEIGTALVEADAIDVEYNKDVNNTNGKVDANDAQLVYNMYQTKAYDGFGTVDMIKFLEADLNTTVGVDSTDAQFIIDYILEN